MTRSRTSRGIDDARVERLRDVRLETGLLMEADLEVGEQHELGARDRVGLEASPVVARERLAQVALPVRRLARHGAAPRTGRGSSALKAESAPHSTWKRANSRPISSNTRTLPRATAALARSSAAAGSTTAQTDASEAADSGCSRRTGGPLSGPRGRRWPLPATTGTPPRGRVRDPPSGSFVRPASRPTSRRCTRSRPARGARPWRPTTRDRPA